MLNLPTINDCLDNKHILILPEHKAVCCLNIHL